MVRQRVLTARLIEKVRKNPELAETVGIKILNEETEDDDNLGRDKVSIQIQTSEHYKKGG